MCVWICVSSRTPAARGGTRRPPSRGRRPSRCGAAAGPRGWPARRSGSSRCRPLRDRRTSSRSASAICVQVSRARLVVAHERPLQDRHRAGQHALHRLLGQRLRVARPVDGHRPRARDVAEDDRAASRSASRSSAPSRSRVKAKPSSCSPKYSTMSLRSNSPCTSTSSPSASCSLDALARSPP